MKIKRRKRVKKERTVFLTALPGEQDINLGELISYCRKNMIPLANVPEEIANKFRI